MQIPCESLRDRPQPLVDVRDRLAPVLPRRVARDVLHRPRAVERDERDQVLELRRLHLPQRVAHARRLELEDARRVGAGEHLVDLRCRPSGSSRCRAPWLTPPISSTALSITSRLRRPRKSIFSRPSASTFFIETWVTISWSAPFCCSGTTSISGCAPITTAGGVDRVGPRQALERPGEVDDLLRDRVVLDRGRELAARLHAPPRASGRGLPGSSSRSGRRCRTGSRARARRRARRRGRPSSRT